MEIDVKDTTFHIRVRGVQHRDIPIKGIGNYNSFMCREFLKLLGKPHNLKAKDSYLEFEKARDEVLKGLI
jgi:hypothetical protein